MIVDGKRERNRIVSPTRAKEIMAPREAAEYLSIHVRTIYRLARSGNIPGRKVGGSWRFRKEVLNEWLSGDRIPANTNDESAA